MSFSQKSDLFFRFEKLGVRRKSPVSPAALHSPARRRAAPRRKGALGQKTSTAPGRALFAVVLSPRDVDDPEDARCVPRAATFLPTAGRKRDHAGRVFRVFAPAVGSRSRDGRHARTSRRRHSRLFFPTRRTARLPDFSEPPPPSAQGQRQGEPRERAAPVSYRRAGVGHRRLPRRRCPPPTPARPTRRRCSNAPTRSWSSSATRSQRATSARRSRARARRTPSPRPGPSA